MNLEDYPGLRMAADAAVSEPQSKELNMPNDTPLDEREDYQAGHAAGLKAATDRMNAVFASEYFAGREAKAAKLLGKPGLSAEDITDLLADEPKREELSEEQQRQIAEEAGRDEMKAAMEAAGNKDLGADDGSNKDGKTGRAAADAVWDRANAAVGRVNKEG